MSEVDLDTVILGRSLRQRMEDHPGPYYAETASVKGDDDYPNWIVCGLQGFNVLGVLLAPYEAVRFAVAMDKARAGDPRAWRASRGVA